MKSVLPKHISEKRKKELQAIVKMIRLVVKAEKIILFGSYARGNFIERDEQISPNGYKTIYESDYDILVIIKSEAQDKNSLLWSKIDRLIAENEGVKTRTDIIHDTIDFVNESLRKGVSFYTDIREEGVMLYDNSTFPLEKPRKLDKTQRIERAKEFQIEWLASAKESWNGYTFYHSQALLPKISNLVQRKRLNEAAFNLHQMAERTYVALWLMLFEYQGKLHDLEKLSARVEKVRSEFAVFGKRLKKNKDLFLLLKRAYVEARYNKSYRISPEELLFLEKRVKKLYNKAKRLKVEELYA